jgi:alpha-1,2-mannosyltransferase
MHRPTRSGAFREPLRGRPPGAALVFLASSVLLAGVLLTHGGMSFDFFDLKVYRQAAGLVLDGRPLYGATFGRGLGFAYPPVAAVLFTPLRVCSLRGDEIAVTLVNLALVAVLAHCAMRLRGAPADAAQRSRRSRAAWLAAAAALWIMPVTSAIGYGQIDVLIAVLVLVDLTFGCHARWGGLLVGAAAALKLTPLIFIPYLALSGRPRMAARAVGAFTLSIALAFDVVPDDARAYWSGGVFDTSHITGGGGAVGRGPANQSLHGALLRVASGLAHLPVVWLAVCALVGVTGLLLAVSAARRGDEAWGLLSTAVTGLLICPVTWIHHGMIALPGLLSLLAGPQRSVRRSVRVVIVLAAVAGSWAIMPMIAAHPGGEHLDARGLLLSDLYVIAGLATLVTAAVLEGSARRSGRDQRRPPPLGVERDDQTAAAGGARGDLPAAAGGVRGDQTAAAGGARGDQTAAAGGARGSGVALPAASGDSARSLAAPANDRLRDTLGGSRP